MREAYARDTPGEPVQTVNPKLRWKIDALPDPTHPADHPSIAAAGLHNFAVAEIDQTTVPDATKPPEDIVTKTITNETMVPCAGKDNPDAGLKLPHASIARGLVPAAAAITGVLREGPGETIGR